MVRVQIISAESIANVQRMLEEIVAMLIAMCKKVEQRQ
jgi:hypothetical protein